MGIQEFIARKKQEFFVSRSASPVQLAMQRDALAKERARLQLEQRLREDVQKEQRQIRDIRSQPARERLAQIKQGFKAMKDRNIKNEQSGVRRFSSGQSSPFSPSSNPFGPDKVERVKEPKQKSVTVTVRQ